MNSWQEMPDWEKALYVLTEECINEDRFNILNLYLKLSNSAANWIQNKKYGILGTLRLFYVIYLFGQGQYAFRKRFWVKP